MNLRAACLLSVLAIGLLNGCSTTSHPVITADLGTVSSAEAMEALLEQTGPIEFATVAAADWTTSLKGLLNLSNPKAKAAQLKERDEPVQLFVHVLKHPTRGLFIVDTGLSKKVVENSSAAGVSWLVKKGMGLEKLKLLKPTQDLLQAQGQPLKGVFLTHLHIDHIVGMPDIGNEVPLYTGEGEASESHWYYAVTQGTVTSLLEGKAPLRELRFQPDPSGRFEGVLDVFGDGSLFAIKSAGHTLGSTAFVVRTPQGAVLLTGDTCHTRWGWDNGVEPGEFTADRKTNLKNLLSLKDLVARHPKMDVRLGHQR